MKNVVNILIWIWYYFKLLPFEKCRLVYKHRCYGYPRLAWLRSLLPEPLRSMPALPEPRVGIIWAGRIIIPGLLLVSVLPFRGMSMVVAIGISAAVNIGLELIFGNGYGRRILSYLLEGGLVVSGIGTALWGIAIHPAAALTWVYNGLTALAILLGLIVWFTGRWENADKDDLTVWAAVILTGLTAIIAPAMLDPNLSLMTSAAVIIGFAAVIAGLANISIHLAIAMMARPVRVRVG